MPIAYEPHPVTPERKAELISQGFTIVDARFAPDDVKPVDVDQAPEAPKKRKRGKRNGS